MKQLKKHLALFLVVMLSFQSIGMYAQEETLSEPVLLEQEEQDNEEIFVKAVQAQATTSSAIDLESGGSIRANALYGTTVRGGRHADTPATTGSSTIPREAIQAKWSADESYSRRGYMEFDMPTDVDWEQVTGIKLTMYLHEHFGSGKQDIMQIYKTSKPSISEENWTWNNTPTLNTSDIIGEQEFFAEDEGQWVEIDITSLKDELVENPGLQFALAIYPKTLNDQAGIQFFSQYKDGGIYTPYLNIYQGEYKDELAPTLKVTDLYDGLKAIKKELTFDIHVADNYDDNPSINVVVNNVVQEAVNGTNTIILDSGNNVIEISAQDMSGNISETLTYHVEYSQSMLYPVVADTYVEKHNPDKIGNNDSRGLLLKKPATGNMERRTYLAFDVSANEEPYVKEANIQLYARELMGTDRTTEVINIYEVPEFDEYALTWNTAPAVGEKAGTVSYQRTGHATVMNLDIAPFINQKLASGAKLDKLYFALEVKDGHDQKGAFLASRETDIDNAAKLVFVEGLPAPTLEVSGIEQGSVHTHETLYDVLIKAKSVNDTVSVNLKVDVNGVEIRTKGDHLYDIPLMIGENTVRITATDQEENVVEKEFKLTRLESQISGTYYVDSFNGDDDADGLSEESAWKSLDKLNAIQFQPGTQILFKRGGVWNGQFKPKGSGTADAPIIVDAYGENPSRPIINGNGISNLETANVTAEGAIHLYNVSYWEVNGLEVTNQGADIVGADRVGIMVYAGGNGYVEHIYINDVYVHDVNTDCDGDKLTGGIIFLGDTRDEKGNATDIPSGFKDIRVEDSHIKNVAIEGLRTKTYRNGSNTGSIKNYDVVFRNNLIEDIHGDGIVLAEIASGGLAEKNIVRRHSTCPKSRNYAGLWLYQTDGVIIQYNEVYDGVHGYNDGEAFDFDIGTKNNIYQYNYSHNNKGGFLLTMTSAGVGNVFRYNISQNDGNGNEIFFCMNDRVKIYNNTIYVGEHITLPYFIQEDNIANMFFKNNLVYVDGTIEKFSEMSGNYEAANMSHNIMYPQSLLELEGSPNPYVGLNTQDPMLVSPEVESITMDTWIQSIWDANIANFKLQDNSPAIDGGIIIEDSGTQDIYGTKLYVGEKADIGAHEFSRTPVVAVDSIVLSDETLALQENTNHQLKATVLPENATNKAMTWSSSDEEVATVGTDGLVHALREGQVTITVTAVADTTIQSSCQITVEKETGEGDGAGSNTGNSSHSNTNKSKTVEQAWKNLDVRHRNNIQRQFVEVFSYTVLEDALTLEKLEEATLGQFTRKQLIEIQKKPSLLKELGIPIEVLKLQKEEAKEFIDMPKEHWAHDAISALSEKGIVKGYSLELFNPDQPLKAEDTMTFLDRVFLIHDIGGVKNALAKETLERYIHDQEHWAYYPMMSMGARLSETTLQALAQLEGQPISRALLAQVLLEATGEQLPQKETSKMYTDIEKSAYKEAIEYCVATGLLQGTADDKMSPNKELTRAEMAMVLQRLDTLVSLSESK